MQALLVVKIEENERSRPAIDPVNECGGSLTMNERMCEVEKKERWPVPDGEVV